MTGYKVRIGNAYVRYVSDLSKSITAYGKDEQGRFLKRDDVETIKQTLGPDVPITVEEYDLTWQKVNG